MAEPACYDRVHRDGGGGGGFHGGGGAFHGGGAAVASAAAHLAVRSAAGLFGNQVATTNSR